MTEYLRQKPIGLVRDLPPEEAGDAYTNANNVIFYDEAAVRAPGWDVVFGTPLGAPQFVLSVLAPLARYWIYCHADGVAVTDGITHWDITPAAWSGGGFEPQQWTGASLNGLPVINNGTTEPYWWDWNTSSAMQALPGWPAGVTCKLIRDYKYHLVALNLTVNAVLFPNQLMWSSAAEPGAIPDTWSAAPDNDAGDNILAATPGAITDAYPLRDGLMIYKQHSAYLMSYIGGNFVFDTRKKFVTIGALTSDCVAEFLGNNVVMTDGDVVVTDGHDAKSIVDRRIRNAIFKTIDPDYYQRSFVVHYKAANQVWVCWPETGKSVATRAAVWDTVADNWGLRDLPEVAFIGRGLIGVPGESTAWDDDAGAWDDDATAWNEQAYNPTQDGLLMAQPGGPALLAVGLTDYGQGAQAINASIEKVGLDFGDSERVKTAVRLWPRVTGQAGELLYFRLGGQMWRDDPVSWSDFVPYEIGSEDAVDIFATGRFLSMRMYSVAAHQWRCHGFDIEFQQKGKF